MGKVDDLQKEVHLILDSLRSYVETASDMTWRPSDGILPVVYRAILRRQFESLDAISFLVANERGYAAPPLLRSSCEELIWIKYLTGIANSDAEQLLLCAQNDEVFHSVKAQDDYAGRSVTKKLRLLRVLKNAERVRKSNRKKLMRLGKKLTWDRHTTQSGQLPSLKWLARKTGQTDIYNYIYHAPSRFVHFSSHELLRRAWGKPGNLSIRSVHFRDYWGAFALYWGFRLFLDSMIELCHLPGMPEMEVDEAKFAASAERVGAHGRVPIITAEELAWPK